MHALLPNFIPSRSSEQDFVTSSQHCKAVSLYAVTRMQLLVGNMQNEVWYAMVGGLYDRSNIRSARASTTQSNHSISRLQTHI